VYGLLHRHCHHQIDQKTPAGLITGIIRHLNRDIPAFQSPIIPAFTQVAVKLPDLQEQDLKFWFAQTDSVFCNPGTGIIRSLTKYDHWLAKLPAAFTPAIRELARHI
jgi:hypothetical protein